MQLVKTVLKRPVTTLLVVLCLIVFGCMSLFTSRVELMPEMNMPMHIISTVYPGANPENINELVTMKIEDELSSLSGVKTVQSQSMENASLVIIQYDYGKDMNMAYDDLKKKVDLIKQKLPEDCQEPSIIEMNLSDQAVVMLSVSHSSESDVSNYVENVVVTEFKKIPEVTDVTISGGNEKYVKIELIPEKLAQYKLDINSLATTIASADFTFPVGKTEFADQNLSISVETKYDTIDLLKEIPIILSDGSVIALEDVANIYINNKENTGIARFNGNDTISLGIKKQQSATEVEVSKKVKNTIKTLTDADPDLSIITVSDTSDAITSSLESVMQTMIMAIIVSMFIIYLFFGEVKASLIVGTSIPISILSALILIEITGFSLNIITLSSLVLGVGMMVDNSIVVLESCFRTTKKGGFIEYMNGAIEGSGVVIQSIIGSTLTTCVVFLPLALIEGLSGQMFKPLGFTIIYCMISSLISAITIVPLCYCYYKPKEKENTPVSNAIEKCQNGYRNLMKSILSKKKMVMFITLGLLSISIWMATQLRSELITADNGNAITITAEVKPGQTKEAINELLSKIENYVKEDNNVTSYMLTFGGSGIGSLSTSATLNAYLSDDTNINADELAKNWRKDLNNIPGMNIKTEVYSMLSGMVASTNSVEYILQSTQYNELKMASDNIVKDLMKRDEIYKVNSSLENAAPVIKIDIDSIKANAEMITPIQVAGQINSILGGVKATTITIDGNTTDVNVEFPDGQYDELNEVKGIMIKNNIGQEVALADIAKITFKDSPETIVRADRQYQVTISAELANIAEANKDLIENQLYNEIVLKHLTPTITRATNSMTDMMNDEFSSLLLALFTSVFLVFVVMAAQFESPKFSIMVMTTIPFSLIGSFGLLYIGDVSISMPTLLGFVMLVGTVVNNGILYVDTVNQYRAEMDVETALIEGGATRIRPILMTTLTTVVAMIPMAMGYGDSGATLQGLAMVNLGGLITSTILALTMLPSYYLIMDGKKHKNI